MNITIYKRKDRCFSKAVLTTNLNSLSLLVHRAICDIELDLQKTTNGPKMRELLEEELSELKSLSEQMSEPDLLIEGVRVVRLSPKK